MKKFNIKQLGPFYKYEGHLSAIPLEQFMERNANVYGKILDAGCGNMPYRRKFLHASEYVGIDYVKFPAFTAKDMVGDITNLPFEKESFDIVLNNQVIEHVNDPKKVLNEINRVIVVGGTLILTAPQMCRIHGEPHDYYRFTKFGLEYLITSSGFEIVSIESMGGFWRAFGSHLNFYIMENIKNIFLKNVVRKTLINFNNIMFSFLDKHFYWDKDTLGYMVIARKK